MSEPPRTLADIIDEGVLLRLGPTDVPAMAVRLYVVGGDFARQGRDVLEGRDLDLDEATRELANVIISSARWIVELGGNLIGALEAALASQKAYAARLEAARRTGQHNDE